MRRLIAVGLLVTVACVPTQKGTSAVPEPLPAAPPMRPGASRVQFDGNHALDRDTLLSVMHVPERGPYPDDDLARDYGALLTLYRARGYADVYIEVPVVEGDRVRVHIIEGRRYRIGKVEARDVDVKGAAIATPDGRPTRSHLHERTGDWFDVRTVADEMAAIARLYSDVGYPLAQPRLDTPLDRNHGVIDIIVTGIDRGAHVIVDGVRILGAPDDSVASIRRTIAIADGKPYDETQVLAAKQRIVAFGRFERVDVSCGPYNPDAAEAHAMLTFELTPRPR